MPGALESLKRASNLGYLLFIVSNQPSYAKGKVYILRVMTHREYDRANQGWKDQL